MFRFYFSMKPKKRRRMRGKKNHLNTAAGDWSELPKELLNLISEGLDNEFELIRFRSICSHWRSSSVSNLNSNDLPFNFPLKSDFYYSDSEEDSDDDSDDHSDEDSNNDSDDDSEEDSDDDANNITNNKSFCSFSKRNIFLIKPLQLKQTRNCRPLLIRVTQNSSAKSKRYPFLPFDLPCPFSIDLTKFSIHHYGTDFIVDESLSYHYIQPVKVVAVTPLILAIFLNNDNLVLLHCGNKHWTKIPNMPLCIGDICLFKGRLYAVERSSSQTVIVVPEDLSVQLVVKDVNGEWWKRKFLVESEGELLLVDISSWCVSLTIDVFMLDEEEKEWVKLTSLGDRVLFLGNGCSFSASAMDLWVTKGNCVIFMEDNILYNKICDTGMCVFDMDQGQLFPMRSYPHYFNLFWPAPDWIDINCMREKTKKRASSPYTGAKPKKRM